MLGSKLRRAYDKTVPEIWRQRVHVARGGADIFLPCFDETGVLQIHVPKAAGTSISYALYGGNIGHRSAQEYVRISRRRFHRHFTFGFVRNPWDRAVSAYEFARQGGTEWVRPSDDPVFGSALFADFSTFVTEWLVHADLRRADVVFRPQTDFLCDDSGTVLVDHVGRTESLPADLAPVEEALGASLQLDHLNSVTAGLDYRDAYTPELERVVAEVYASDIESFGYEFESR